MGIKVLFMKCSFDVNWYYFLISYLFINVLLWLSMTNYKFTILHITLWTIDLPKLGCSMSEAVGLINDNDKI